MGEAVVWALMATWESLTCSQSEFGQLEALPTTCKLRPKVPIKDACVKENTKRFLAQHARAEQRMGSAHWSANGTWDLHDFESKGVDDISWIASKPKNDGNEVQGTLIFNISGILDNVKKQILSKEHSLAKYCLKEVFPILSIKVTHMSASHNMGWVNVFACGWKVARLDALWDNPRTIQTDSDFKLDMRKCISMLDVCSSAEAHNSEKSARSWKPLDLSIRQAKANMIVSLVYPSRREIEDENVSKRLPGAKFKII